MSRLVRVELRRIFTRRLVQVLMVLSVAVPALALFGLVGQVSSVDENRAEAQRWHQEALEQWEQDGEEMVADCREAETEERERSGDPSIDFGCDQMTEPQLSDFIMELPPVAEQIALGFTGMSLPVMFLALLIGATATAAEFTTRSIGTWLTFEPRRDRVYGSKVLATAVAVVPMALVFVAVMLLAIPAIYAAHDLPAGLGDQWSDVLAGAGRAVLLITAAAAVGSALGLLLRHTGAVLGAVIGYLIVVEGILTSITDSIQRWLISKNVEAWLAEGAEWMTYDCDVVSSDGGCQETVHALTLTEGGAYLAAVTALVVAVSWLVFRRADID